MHVQSCCFACSTTFVTISLSSPSWHLKVLSHLPLQRCLLKRLKKSPTKTLNIARGLNPFKNSFQMFNLNTTKEILFTFMVSMYQELGKS